MLKDFLDGLVALVRRGDAPHVADVPGQPLNLLVAQGGKYELLPKHPPLRNHTMHSLESLIDFLKARYSETAQVFLSPESVVALLEGDDRRERATLKLTPTVVHTTLRRWENWTSYSPDQILRELRGMGVPEDVTAALRRLDFKRASATAVESQHGRESLGRRVEAEVQGADKVPEHFVIRARLFVEEGVRAPVPVRVEVYLNVNGETIDLRVWPDHLAIAVGDVLQGVKDIFEEEHGVPAVPVFFGTP